MPFILFIDKNINRLNNALDDTLANTLKEPRKLILSHLFLQIFFVHSIQEPLVPDNTYCLKIIITLVDSFRALNITKFIRWMITLLILLVILMLSQKDNFFYHRMTTLPSHSSQSQNSTIDRAHFRLQGKCPIRSKMHPTLLMQVELILQN